MPARSSSPCPTTTPIGPGGDGSPPTGCSPTSRIMGSGSNGSSDPCPCRSPDRRALPPGEARRRRRHRRPYHDGPARSSSKVFNARARIRARRFAVRSPVQGRRDTSTSAGLEGRGMHTPGHTPACMTYPHRRRGFVGDTLFMPDYGTARWRFPGGDAGHLYRSIQKLLSDAARDELFMCHDYKAPEREKCYVGDHRLATSTNNVHAHDGVSESEFVRHAHHARRHARHAGPDPPVGVGQRPRWPLPHQRRLLSQRYRWTRCDVAGRHFARGAKPR